MFWILTELKEYLIYLDNWFNFFHNKKQPERSRPKSLYLSGCGSSDKSS